MFFYKILPITFHLLDLSILYLNFLVDFQPDSNLDLSLDSLKPTFIFQMIVF
jgi:hypothetical protein